MTRTIAKEYVGKREALGYPLMKMADKWAGAAPVQTCGCRLPPPPTEAADLLIEIGVEEMPADDVADVLSQLEERASTFFDELRLSSSGVEVHATPRRVVMLAREVAPRQSDEESVAKGPPAARAIDKHGNPTRAALGFARGKGVDVADLLVQEIDGGTYVTARVRNVGRPATAILAEAIPRLIDSLHFRKTMRWNDSGVAFSRPIRWIMALFGDAVIPFEFAGVASNRVSRGLRPLGSSAMEVADCSAYERACQDQCILLDFAQRNGTIQKANRSIGP